MFVFLSAVLSVCIYLVNRLQPKIVWVKCQLFFKHTKIHLSWAMLCFFLLVRWVKVFCKPHISMLFSSLDIKSAKTRGEAAPKPLRFLQKIEKPVPRPPTPSVEVPDDVS